MLHKSRLEELVITDPLTGLHNRRYLDTVLPREFEQAKRHDNDLACLMLDLDHFKRINDTFGHEFGDTVLKKFAAILALNVRIGDYAFRYGGEEFVALLPLTGKMGAVEVGEKIRIALAAHEFSHNTVDEPIRLTISVGVATMCSQQPVTPNELIAFADQALYMAKANGRNQLAFQESSQSY